MLQRTIPRRIAYTAFTALSFLLCLYLSFPMDAVGQRLVSELSQRSDGKISMTYGSINTYWFTGIEFEELTMVYEREEGDPLKARLGNFKAHLGLLPLLGATIDVGFTAGLGEGEIDGNIKQAGKDIAAEIEFHRVDFSKPPIIPTLLGMPTYGQLSGKIDVDWTQAPRERKGKASMTLENAAIGPGEIPLPIPGMSGLKVPGALQLGKINFSLSLNAGKAKITTFQQQPSTQKPDILLRKVNANLNMKKNFRASAYDTCIEVKLDDAAKKRFPTLDSLMELASAMVRKDSTGFLHLPVSGNFSGKPRTAKRLCPGTTAK